MKLEDVLKQHKTLHESFNTPAFKAFVEHQKNYKAPITIGEGIQSLTESVKHLPEKIKYYALLESITSAILMPGEGLQDLVRTIALISKDFNFSKLVDLKKDKEDKNIFIDETKRIKRIITDIYNDNSTLLNIEPREFEEIVAELLNSQGFKVELSKQTRDNGYDIIALKYLDKHNPLKFLVECKRYKKSKIGVEIIRSFKEVIQTEKANRGIIVTTSYFSADAKKKQADTPYLLDYKDKDNVIEWINDYWKSRIDT